MRNEYKKYYLIQTLVFHTLGKKHPYKIQKEPIPTSIRQEEKFCLFRQKVKSTNYGLSARV